MTYDKLSDYYGNQPVLPTFSQFKTQADLVGHEAHRRALFTGKLYLPPRLFQNANLIEFGPDTGENSLVFARWGANCTLVEPNIKAHGAIQEYFETFGLADKLLRLDAVDILSFGQTRNPGEKYDIVDAEGFIYTVKPEQEWINLFAEILNPGGFVILFYYEAFSSLFELLQKVIHVYVRHATGLNANQSAQALFRTKWNSIPHRRPMEAWVMDVLENPFVRLRYFLEPLKLTQQMDENGFDLYSSWPPYRDSLNVHWFKKVLPPAEQLRLQANFIARSRLSQMFGRGHFIAQLPENLDELLADLLKLIDNLIDQIDEQALDRCMEDLDTVAKLIGSQAVISEPDAIELTQGAIQCVQQILRLIKSQNVDALLAFCNHDPAFIRTWGMPSHFAIYQLR